MKIRSLLLGSVAAAGLATTGFAADLGVVTSLDVCDELGLSGLTISSDDNCLVITGGVSFEYSIGNYAPARLYSVIDNADDYELIDNVGPTDAELDIDAWLAFAASANSDFGQAKAVIKLLSEDNGLNADFPILVDEAYVSIGDTTVIMAGRKSSIFNDGDDGALDYLGLFGGDADFSAGAPTTGGNVIQLVHNLGNGLSIGGGVENLQTSSAAVITGVGVIAYAGDGITAHASGAINQVGDWKVHSGFTGAWDPIKVVGAISADSTGWWNAVGSASATFDMFTLAASGEATASGEWGAAGSVSAGVSDDVKINLGGRFFNGVGANDSWQVEAGVSAGVTESITLTAAVGVTDSNRGGAPLAYYGKAGLAWAPGGGFTSSIGGEVNSLGGYKATFKAAKTIK